MRQAKATRKDKKTEGKNRKKTKFLVDFYLQGCIIYTETEIVRKRINGCDA